MSASPDDDLSIKAGASPRWFGICLALLSGIFLILGLRAVLSASTTTDEPGHYRYGHRILRGVAERWDDSKMPVSALNALPCYVLEKSGSILRDLDEDHGPCDWTLARIPTLLGGLMLGLAIASWSKALFGWPGALVSFGLFASDPNLIAHSSLVTTDVFGALFLLLSLRAFALWLAEPKPKQSVLLGLAVGGAFVSKYTAAYLLIIFAVAAWLARKALVVGSPGRRPLPGLALAIAIALLAINVGFLGDGTGASLRDQRFESPQFRELRKVPVLASLPLPLPRPFIEGLDRVFHRERSGGGSGNLYFMGELRTPGSEGFVSYFLVVGLLKTPLPAIAALIIAAALWFRRDDRALGAQEITLLSAVFIFAVYFSFLFRAQIGLRHFLVVFPPLFVLAGKLGPFLSQSRARAALGALGLGLSVLSVIRHGDDPLSYFNELVEPTRTYRIAADSNLEWGQTRGRIESYLAAHPEVLNAPAQPFKGRILVGANQLTGVVMRKRMEWLRESGLEPVGHVAFTHFLFDVSEADALRLRRGRAERSPEPPL
jgi:hypothetical protein